MQLSRRQCLIAGGATVTALAGCTSGSGTAGGSGDDEETSTDAVGRTTSSGPLRLKFGETAVFTNDEAVELEVTPTDARLTEAIITGGKGGNDQVYATSPDDPDSLYLLVTFELRNAGSSETKIPGGLFFTASGEQVSRTVREVPGQNYGDLDWVEPGETVRGTVLFETPADAESGVVEARFRTLFQSPPVEWELGLSELPRKTFDFEGKSPGEAIELGTEEYRYSFTALGTTESTEYEASNEGTQTPADGNKFVFVEVESENVGTSPVTLPSPYDMRLVTADSKFEAGTHKNLDERYRGGPSDPGEVRTGDVLFEVPESVSSYTLQVEFSNGPIGTWQLG